MSDSDRVIFKLKAEVLRWRVRCYSYAATPYLLLVLYQIVADSIFFMPELPKWVVGFSAIAFVVLTFLSFRVAGDLKKLTGETMYW